MRIEHDPALIWCPICEGRGFCLECLDGLTLEAYEKVQCMYHEESNLERSEAHSHDPEELKHVL